MLLISLFRNNNNNNKNNNNNNNLKTHSTFLTNLIAAVFNITTFFVIVIAATTTLLFMATTITRGIFVQAFSLTTKSKTSLTFATTTRQSLHFTTKSPTIFVLQQQRQLKQQQLQQQSLQRLAMSTTPTSESQSQSQQSPQQQLFLFDFDGVVCDSCNECTVSALKTLQRLKVHDDNVDEEHLLPEYPPDWLFEKMREIRPAIEVGWQIPVLLSVFWEQQQQQYKIDASNDTPMSVDEIIGNYESLVHDWLSKHSLTDQDMITTFGTIRDEWIQNDYQSWLDINTFYTNVPKSLNECCGIPILVTTKQQRFAIALCRHAGITDTAMPDDVIYGLGQYKNKQTVIVDQMKQHGNVAPQNTHFFEDRWPTLAKCLQDERLNNVNLYLCAWGYVTKQELELAHAEPRVTVLQLQDFETLVTNKQQQQQQ